MTTIKDFKQVHKDSDCNPNTLWDSLKCVVTGVSIEYSSRKKRERNKEKNSILADIDKVKLQLSTTTSNQDCNLLLQLEELEGKLNKIYDFETKGLIIRSRVRWLEDGEKNSKYFCNLKNRSWQKKSINRLKNAEGILLTDHNKITAEIENFYTKLYSFQDGVPNILNEMEVNEAIFDKLDIPQLNEDDKASLERPITKQELYDVLKSMKINKTPGYDGIPVEFYIVFWPDVCDMLLNSFNFSLQNGGMSSSQRNGVITLIAKKR